MGLGIEATTIKGSDTDDCDLPSLKSLVFEIEGQPWLLLLLSRDRVDISKVNPLASLPVLEAMIHRGSMRLTLFQSSLLSDFLIFMSAKD